MLDKIIDHALKNRWLVIATILVGSLVGFFVLKELPVDAVPDITNVQVVVNTKTGALDPEQIEKTVTYPIETQMASLANVDEVRSLSKYGLSQVVVVFEEGTDIYWARQQVAEHLQSIIGAMPQGINPELGPITTGLGEIFMYAVLPKEGSELAKKTEKERLLYLRTIQDYIIAPQLIKVDGVASVDSNGGFSKEIHVNIIPSRLERYGLTMSELAQKLETMGESFGGGYIEKDQRQIIVRTRGMIKNLNDIRQFPLKLNVFGGTITVSDVANVSVDHAQRVGAATYDGKETVLGTALMRIGANSRQAAIDLEEKLKQITLPDDVHVEILYTRSFLVDATVSTVATNLAEGAALVVIILLLILGHIRAAILVALAIPISMLFAVIGMQGLGISANLMSLGAIDFGLLVDGSVVMIENYIRRLENSNARTLDERLQLVKEAAKEVAGPVTIGLTIIMIVYVPILTLTGVEGKLFRPMALTVLMALGASLVVAMMLMPVLAYLLLSPEKPGDNTKGHSDPFLFKWIKKVYQPFITYSLKKPLVPLVPAVIFAAVSFLIFPRLGSDFVPQLDEGDLVMGLTRNTDISLSESVEQQLHAEKIIASFKEVSHVFSRLGTPESATDPMGVYLADTFVILEKDHSKWPEVNGTKRNKARLFEDIAAAIHKKYPETDIAATQPIEMRFNEILEGSRADVTLRIFGNDLEKLMSLISQAEEVVTSIDGAQSVEQDALTALQKSPVLDIELNHRQLTRYGIDIEEANRVLEMAMSGYRVGSLYEADWRFPIMMHIDENLRNSYMTIRRIPVGLPDGGAIPLSMVTNVKESEQVTTIARSFAKRYAAVSIYLKNRDIQSFVNEAREKVESALDLPEGYYVTWGGQFKNLERAQERLMLIIPATLIIIFLLLQRVFRNIGHTVLVYLSIPFAATGGILSLYFRDISFSVSAAVGFIALTGIAILNAMVLVSFFKDLLKQGVPLKKAVFEGSMTRLRPVIMTALVASLGFLPMAINTGLGAEVQRPLATVVIGGLITSTLLTLVLLPSLFYLLEKRKKETDDT